MSTTPAKEARLVPVSFDDADLFYEWERRLGWDVESTQLSFFDHETGRLENV
jgi:hypothetical protein